MDGRQAALIIFFFLISGFLTYWWKGLRWLAAYILILAVLELASYLLIRKSRKLFPWLITPPDELPALSEEGLKKFLPFGYDPELGWVRKPNTEKDELGPFLEEGKHHRVTFHIDERGTRKNPGHDHLPQQISCYGDSFTFSRQVEDDQTWPWYLSELSRSKVLNFGIGNYGMDQALLRLKREYPKNKTGIVIMGVVPSTIVRILDIWKHYNEFGNTFGFKPRFDLKDGKLVLIPNIIDSEEKYHHYQDYIESIRKNDYFYTRKFKKEMLQFPYFVSLLSNPARNFPLLGKIWWHQVVKKEDTKSIPYPSAMQVIMKVNLKLRYNLFTKDTYATDLFLALAEEFKRYVGGQKAIPVFLLLPQKDDILFVRKRGKYYGAVVEEIRKKMLVVDLTEPLREAANLDALYSDPNGYGGHYSKLGNEFVAREIMKVLSSTGVLTSSAA